MPIAIGTTRNVVAASVVASVLGVAAFSHGADAGGNRANTNDVLLSPSREQMINAMRCESASYLMAKGTRHVREAEMSVFYRPEAEDEYDEALEALMQDGYEDAIGHFQAADKALHKSPQAESHAASLMMTETAAVREKRRRCRWAFIAAK